MTIIEKVQGNAHDEEWKSILQGATIDHLTLDQWDAQKNRFRKQSDAGTELAVSLDRGTFLRDGDILMWDAETRTAVVTVIQLKEVLVVEMKSLLEEEPEVMLRTAIEIGHALGNQHWPAVVKGSRIFVPMAVDRKVMSSVMKTHAFEGITYEFVPGAEVIPYMAPHESRRLFGGAESPVHTHHHHHAHH
jgi:urease accessory protein